MLLRHFLWRKGRENATSKEIFLKVLRWECGNALRASYPRCWWDNRRVSPIRMLLNVNYKTDRRKTGNPPIPGNCPLQNRSVVSHVVPFYRAVKSALHTPCFKDITNGEAAFPFSQLSILHCTNLFVILLSRWIIITEDPVNRRKSP